jgi:hypothetical protein
MITQKVIETLYKRYCKRPKSTDDLNIALLFEGVHPMHDVAIEDENVVVNSVEDRSPFHRIPLALIHAIVEFEEYVAIVLHSTVIFLSRIDNIQPVSIHLKPIKLSLKDRFFTNLTRTSCAVY